MFFLSLLNNKLQNLSMIDIHTHRIKPDEHLSVYNLRLNEMFNQAFIAKRCLLSIGIHPWDIESITPESVLRIAELAAGTNTVAIGECGLDKNIAVPLSVQKQIFETQIELSEQSRKPLIIHCVGRFNELLEMKKYFQPCQQWIVHGFRGKPQLASQLLDGGISLSFGEKFNHQSITITPLECIFTETDESDMDFEKILINISVIKRCAVEDLKAGDHLFAPYIQQPL